MLYSHGYPETHCVAQAGLELAVILLHLYHDYMSQRTNVMAIPGCQLDYIWNELHSRNGGHICDRDLETGRKVSDLDLDMEILRHSGHEKLRL